MTEFSALWFLVRSESGRWNYETNYVRCFVILVWGRISPHVFGQFPKLMPRIVVFLVITVRLLAQSGINPISCPSKTGIHSIFGPLQVALFKDWLSNIKTPIAKYLTFPIFIIKATLHYSKTDWHEWRKRQGIKGRTMPLCFRFESQMRY